MVLLLCSILQDYETVFSKLPNWNIECAHIEPYGKGCTNQNYILSIEDECYFVRIGADAKKALGIPFEKEVELIKIAAALDLSPPLIHAEDEIIIMPFIPSTTVNLHQPETLARALNLLKKLHASDCTLPYIITPESKIEGYLNQLAKMQISLTPYQQGLLDKRPRPAISKLVPCHLDFKGENILDDGKRFWLIDWEYGGMSDPLFDLSLLAPTEAFTPDELNAALELFIPNPTPDERLRFKQFCILSNLCNGLWCLIMSHVSSLDFPYEQWTNELFQDAEIQMLEVK